MDEIRKHFQENLDHQFLRGYRIAALAMGGFFLSMVPLRLSAWLPQELGLTLAWEAGALAGCFLLFAITAPSLKQWLGDVERLGLILFVLGLLNCLLLLAILRQPHHTANFMLMHAAAGLAFRSRARFALMQTMLFGTWFGASLLLPHFAATMHWLPGMTSALLLGIVLHIAISQIFQSLEKLQVHDQIILHQRAKLINELRAALNNVKTLSGLIPICAQCKKVRDDSGYWQQVEHYVSQHSQAEFTHGLCPQCAQELRNEFLKVADIGS